MNTQHNKPVYARFILLILLFGLLVTMPASAQGEAKKKVLPAPDPRGPLQSLENLGSEQDSMWIYPGYQLSGVSYGVAVSGSYAYLGLGPRLIVLNISDPSNPELVGLTGILPGIVQDVIVVGNYAYVAASEGGLRIINISNPLAPVEVGYYDTPGYSYGVTLAGGYIYVSDGASGVRIIDVSNPASPQQFGFFDTDGIAGDVVVVGNYAYVADGNAGLDILNISDPASPYEVGFFVKPGTPVYFCNVAINGSYAYVADLEFGLRIINISTPASPTEVGFLDTAGYALDVVVSGTYAYVADYNMGIRVINISKPEAPSEAGFINAPGYAYAMKLSDSNLFVAGSFGGLGIISIANTPVLSLVGSYDPALYVTDVAISSSYAYLTAGADGLLIFDISTPSSPVFLGLYDTPGYADAVAVSGNYAYVADYHTGLRIINVTTPGSPVEVGFYDADGFTEDVFVSGSYAYLADSSVGLRILDVSTPSTPIQKSVFNISTDIFGVAVSGNYAYVANGDSGLRIVNISNLSSPSQTKLLDTTGYSESVVLSGNYAYISDGSDGLRIINISNPAAAAEVGSFDTPGYAYGGAVVGNYAYVADYGSGVHVLNVSSPSSPALLGSYDTPGLALGVAATGNYIFSADASGGFFVLLACLVPETPTLSSPVDGLLTRDNVVGFAWNAASNASEYLLEVDDNNDFLSPAISVTTPGTTSPFYFEASDGLYYWHVRADNMAGGCGVAGPYSSVRTFTVDTKPPPVPTLSLPVSGAVTYDTTPTFSWSSSTDVTQYRIQVDNSDGYTSPEINATTAANSYTAATALPFGTYNWRVAARDAAGNWSTYSNTWSLTIEQVTSYPVYLPLVTKLIPTYFEGPGEVENNNSVGTANGPIRSGRNYTGAFQDTSDYFSFNTSSTGSISIVLDYTGNPQQLGVSLQLFDDTPASIGYKPGPDTHLIIDVASLPAGRYYVRVYAASPGAGSYTLNVTYP